MEKALHIDRIQQRLADYAYDLEYEQIPHAVIHAATARVIDTLGALIGGFFGEPCRIARDVAAQIPNDAGATVIGTRMKTAPEMAAFANATAARYLEFTDFYHWPGSLDGHASDIVTPVLAIAEHAHVSGRAFVTAIVLGYEVFLRLCDVFPKGAFDYTNCSCIGSAVACGKLLKLTRAELAHCVSMAAVPNVTLKQVRRDGKTMSKPAATGHAGRAGVFAALLAQVGVEGPSLPFEGKAGWCDHVVRRRFALDVLGGADVPFKLPAAQIKMRPAERNTVPLILAAEKLAHKTSASPIERVTVETYGRALEEVGSGEQIWNPDTPEAAYHSMPYVVAAALIDGTVTLRSFDQAHLKNPQLREIMRKIALVENAEFTQAFVSKPSRQRARITIALGNGERLISDIGSDADTASPATEDTHINEKFRGLTEDVLGARRTRSLLDQLWNLECYADMALVPRQLVIC